MANGLAALSPSDQLAPASHAAGAPVRRDPRVPWLRACLLLLSFAATAVAQAGSSTNLQSDDCPPGDDLLEPRGRSNRMQVVGGPGDLARSDVSNDGQAQWRAPWPSLDAAQRGSTFSVIDGGILIDPNVDSYRDPTLHAAHVAGESPGGGHGGGVRVGPRLKSDPTPIPEPIPVPPVPPGPIEMLPPDRMALPEASGASPYAVGMAAAPASIFSIHGQSAARWVGSNFPGEVVIAYDAGANSQIARVKRADGCIWDFEPTGIVGTTQRIWRLRRSIDVAGNVETMEYDALGRIQRIKFPSGAWESWFWEEDASLPRITVTYEVDGDGIADSSAAEQSLRWGMEFTPQDGNRRPFAGARLYRIFYPKTPYVTAPDQNSLFGTSPTSSHLVIEVEYVDLAVNGTTWPRVWRTHEYRSATLWAAAPGTKTIIEELTYQVLHGRARVVKVEDRHTILDSSSFDFEYAAFHGAGTIKTAAQVRLTDPRGTLTTYYLDEFLRKTRIVIDPSDDPSGRPRKYDSYFGQGGLQLAEPQTVQWEFIYGASGCGCDRPSEIRGPGPNGSTRSVLASYDAWGKPISRTIPNPSSDASPATITQSWTWSRQTEAQSFVHSPSTLASETGPDGTWLGTTEWETVPGSFQVQPRKHTWKSPLVVDVDGNPSQSTSVVEWNADGFLTRSVDPDGVVLEFAYAAPGSAHVVSITRRGESAGSPSVLTTLAYDAIGRLVSTVEQAGSALARTTQFERDALGRLLAAETSFTDLDPFGASVSLSVRREYLRDFWGNVAVARESNRNSSGAAPVRHSAPGNAGRAWLRRDQHWFGDRLVRTFVDRRALDADESGVLSDSPDARMLEYSYTYYQDGTPHQVLLPNGATRTALVDGYGTLFQTSISNGTDTVVEASHFVDGALQLIAVHRGSHAAGLDLWTNLERQPRSGEIDRVFEPVLSAAPPGYTGSLGGTEHRFVRDAAGRTLTEAQYAGATLLAKLEHEYDQLGRERRTIQHLLGAGPGGTHVVKRRFTPGSRLAELEEPGGRIAKYFYDPLGRVERREDSRQPTANAVFYDYLAGTEFLERRRTRLVQELVGGGETSVEYHTRYSWDVLGRLRKVEELGAGGAQPAETHAFWYFNSGETEWSLHWQGSTQPALGSAGLREQRYLPDALGRLVQHAILGPNPAGIGDDIVLDLIHEDWTDATSARSRRERKDGLGNRTVTHFDFAGRAELEQRPGAPSYAPTATMQEHTLAASFDAASRVTAVRHGTPVNGVAPTTELFWDGADRLLVRQFANVDAFPFHSYMATREVFDRDGLGRVTQARTYAGDLAALVLLDAVGTEQDSAGRVHAERYDFGALDLGATDLWDVVSTYDATMTDRRASLSYESGLQMTLRWDDIGRMAGIDWNPAGTPQVLADYGHFGGQTAWRQLRPKDAAPDTFLETVYAFEAYGRMSRITDSRVGSNPATIDDYQFAYDQFGNLAEERYDRPDGNAGTANAGDAFAYDRFHRLQEAVLGASALPYTPGIDSFVRRLTYGLDHAGNRTSTTSTDASGTTATQTYLTTANRYTQVQPLPATYLYDDRGNLIFDGTHYYVFDFKDRLSEIWLLVEDEVPAEQTELESAGAFEDQQVRTALLSPGPLQAVRQRVLAGLRQAPRTSADLQRMQEYGVLTEPVLLPYGTPIETSGGIQYAQQTTTEATSLQLIALYAYDAYDRRVGRLVVADASTYLHVYDGWREIQELKVDPSTGAKLPWKEFVWGSRLDELVAYRRNDASFGQLAQWTTYHTTQCGHECVLAVLDSNSVLVERGVYDPYGGLSVYGPNEAPLGGEFTSGLPMAWNGLRREAEAPLVYMRHRHYSANLGRFLALDPMGSWFDFLNLGSGYVFGANAPLLYADRFGLQTSAGDFFKIGYEDAVARGDVNADQTVTLEGIAALVARGRELDEGRANRERKEAAELALRIMHALADFPATAWLFGTARDVVSAEECGDTVGALWAMTGVFGRTGGRPKPNHPGAIAPTPGAGGSPLGAGKTSGGWRGPAANGGNARPHGGPAHNQAIDDEIGQLQGDPSVTNIRKNQVQVDVDGSRVGDNRPDVQYDRDGIHHNVEFDTKRSRSEIHRTTIETNDPAARNSLRRIGGGS